MKKFLLIIGLIAVVVMVFGCHGTKTTVPVEQPQAVDTTPPPPPPAPPPPQEPVTPKIMESDFVIVYFDFDKSNIRTDQQVALDKNADILKNHTDINVEVEGHCDDRGTVEYNLALGDRRAQSVKKYLIDLGISADRIKTISYGKERPAVPGTGEDVWAKNRRAVFRIR